VLSFFQQANRNRIPILTNTPQEIMDAVNWQILRLLQEDARISYREIGSRVGLTAPAVAERVHRLEEQGFITGYHAAVNPLKLGAQIMAIIHLESPNDESQRFRKEAANIPEILDCYCVTGKESYILRVAVASVSHLDNLLKKRLVPYGQMRTSIILNCPVPPHPFEPFDASLTGPTED
jgi:Lrp/AsnC family transcriptional regulator, leucine-responsive regulatory protein